MEATQAATATAVPSEEMTAALAARDSDLAAKAKELRDVRRELSQRQLDLDQQRRIVVQRDAALEEARMRIEGLEQSLASAKTALTDREAAGDDLRERIAAAMSHKRITAGLLPRLAGTLTTLRSDVAAMRTLVQTGLGEQSVAMARTAMQAMVGKYSQYVEIATRDLVAKYRYEVRQRKLLYNKLQELKGSYFSLRPSAHALWHVRCLSSPSLPNSVFEGLYSVEGWSPSCVSP